MMANDYRKQRPNLSSATGSGSAATSALNTAGAQLQQIDVGYVNQACCTIRWPSHEWIITTGVMNSLLAIDQAMTAYTSQHVDITTGWRVAGGCGDVSTACGYPSSAANPSISQANIACQLSGDSVDCGSSTPNTCVADDGTGLFGGAGSTRCGLGLGPKSDVNCRLDPGDYDCPATTGDTKSYGTATNAKPDAPASSSSWGVTTQTGSNSISPTNAVADAVNTLTGAFTISPTDLSTAGIGIPFVVTRSYTSASGFSAALGPGWTFNLGGSLAVQPNGDVVTIGSDGQRVYYTKQSDGSFQGSAGALSTLSAITGGYKLVHHDQSVDTFNSAGVLQSELDRNGQGLTFSYDPSGRLSTVTDAADRVAHFAYDSNNDITSITAADGRAVTYGYSNGDLTSVTLPDPDGSGPLSAPVTHYTYDAGGRLATEVDPNGHTVVSNVYDPGTGRITQQTDGDGKTTTFAWDPATSTATTTDPNSHAWKDVYQNGELVQTIDPTGKVTQFGYDSGLDTSSVTAPDGNSTTSLVYDSSHNLTTATAPASLNSVQKTLTYDAENNVKTVTDAANATTSYGYDSAGNNTSVSLGAQQISGATYNSLGEQLTSTDANGKTTTYSYDANGNVASVIDPLGNKTTYTYDSTGQVITKVDPLGNCSGCDPTAHTTTYTYDAEGNLLSKTDPLGHATTYTYDADGNRTSVTDPNGHKTTYAYDNAGHLTGITGPDPDGTGPLTSPDTTFTYDAAGNKLTMVDPRGKTTTYGYDAANRLTSVTTPSGDETTYTYDANGNLASKVDLAAAAAPARAILEEPWVDDDPAAGGAEIPGGTENPANLVKIPRFVHWFLHSPEYYTAVNNRVTDAFADGIGGLQASQSRVIDTLISIGSALRFELIPGAV